MTLRTHHSGGALITCLIVLMAVSTMAVALAGISGANLQIADTQRHANRAFANAESGLETMRYWLARVQMPSSTPPAEYLAKVIADVQNDLQTTATTNLVVNDDGSIPPLTLDPATGEVFQGQWSALAGDPTILRVAATGISGTASRTIVVHFRIEPYRFPIFNYGMATKGALRFPKNPTLTGATANWEADIYVESNDNLLAMQVGGNTNFDGDIDIGNPNASVDFGGAVQIAGDYGQTAIDNHVTVGADPVEFPVPTVGMFQPFATGPVIDSSTSTSSSMTLANATIRSGTNPTFTGNVTIQGILYIESPNVVTFNRNVSLQGLIVADGDVQSPGTNGITFAGNFESGPYPSGSQFDAMRSYVGSVILAPGFGLSFTGNFSAVNGVMAASGLHFSGNSSADVKGTMISYSPDPTFVEGNISMNFDRTAMVEIPAGFDLLRVLNYDPTSYTLAF
jgi:hypothetical protein